ncbi:putative defense protein Hdd11 [Ornithorhynchus anatinus]|uniref:putative defense protein Hdd11 n=1 Tax=Ornithorhynchus anatinus TaxID=9258 RepID=UPI00028F28A1|nr:putative defense protein Hdd11 [Ornithorhynchus anatinus]
MVLGGSWRFLVWTALGTWIVPRAAALGTGAPLSTCEDMQPVHNNTLPQSTPSPFRIEFLETFYTPGKSIHVKIVGPWYKGLLLLAQAENSSTALGTWQDPPPGTRFLECSENSHGAITHSNTELKTSSTTYSWLYTGSECPANVTFVATVAQRRSIYWLRIKSRYLPKDPDATCGAKMFSWRVTVFTVLPVHWIISFAYFQ